MINLIEHINKLGHKVKDKVTGFTGVVTTVSFDLYGCIQVVVVPAVKEDGSLGEGKWFDIGRLEVIGAEPVMKRPTFEWSEKEVASGDKGPAEKPSRSY